MIHCAITELANYKETHTKSDKLWAKDISLKNKDNEFFQGEISKKNKALAAAKKEIGDLRLENEELKNTNSKLRKQRQKEKKAHSSTRNIVKAKIATCLEKRRARKQQRMAQLASPTTSRHMEVDSLTSEDEQPDRLNPPTQPKLDLKLVHQPPAYDEKDMPKEDHTEMDSTRRCPALLYTSPGHNATLRGLSHTAAADHSRPTLHGDWSGRCAPGSATAGPPVVSPRRAQVGAPRRLPPGVPSRVSVRWAPRASLRRPRAGAPRRFHPGPRQPSPWARAVGRVPSLLSTETGRSFPLPGQRPLGPFVCLHGGRKVAPPVGSSTGTPPRPASGLRSRFWVYILCDMDTSSLSGSMKRVIVRSGEAQDDEKEDDGSDSSSSSDDDDNGNHETKEDATHMNDENEVSSDEDL